MDLYLLSFRQDRQSSLTPQFSIGRLLIRFSLALVGVACLWWNWQLTMFSLVVAAAAWLYITHFREILSLDFDLSSDNELLNEIHGDLWD